MTASFPTLAALLAAAALALPARAQAPRGPETLSPYYGGVHLGLHSLGSWPATVDFGGVRTEGQAALKGSLHGGLLVGRRTENARFEVEWQRGLLPVRGVTLGPVSQGADVSGHYQALTVNALRTLPLAERWLGLVGVGIGRGQATLPQVSLSNGCPCFAGASRSATAYQARIGAEYLAQGRWRPQVSLSWLHLSGPQAAGKPAITYGSRGVVSLNAGAVMHF
ncbi:MAG: hypothetical protein HY855_06665 [Burkholderiales bacterium]|nr:hypothetical protein [Burkholderiales bacterium]